MSIRAVACVSMVARHSLGLSFVSAGMPLTKGDGSERP
jgi:hypothetical protein